MIHFILGAVWVVASIAIGIGAYWWRGRQQEGGDVEAALTDIDRNATNKFNALDNRIASLETKVNLLTAFRKPEAK